ncbi:MAG: hypothetical protein ACRDUY_04020 [Nitriliruptorales bacterium]
MATTNSDLRLASNLTLAGAVLAIVGNVAHPIFPSSATAEDFLTAAGGFWIATHLVIGIAIVLLVLALVLLARILDNTAAATLGRMTAVVGGVGGTIFLAQIVAVDGIGNARMAEAIAAADGPAREALLAAAAQIQAIDIAILSVAITLFLGVTFVLLGLALQKAGNFATWIVWLAIAGGAVSTVAGLLLAVQGVTDLALNYLFRPAALVGTIAALGLGLDLRRQASTAGATSPAAG